MAAGSACPAFLALEEVGSSDLEGADLPDPSAGIGALAAIPSFALAGGFPNPVPAMGAATGRRSPAADLAVLDRIHVIPRHADLGSVISDEAVEVEVWNAFQSLGRSLSDLTIEGPNGVTVIAGPAAPRFFPVSDSQIYTILAAAEGEFLIDNLVTWIFLGIDSGGTNLRLTGFRPVVYPFPPDLSRPIQESIGYLTDILTSFNETEQRIRLRSIPVGSIGYAVFFDDVRELQMANAILFGNQARPFGIGRWQFQTPLMVDAGVGAMEVICDPSYLPFDAGGMLLLWRDPFHWEVQRIDAVLSDRISLAYALRNAWSAQGTAVMPLVIGRLSEEEASRWESLLLGSQELEFSIDGFRP